MAEVKISQLVLFTPELADQIVVNDVTALVTKRSSLQDIRDLANQNIDDTVTGSKVTGTLEVTNGLTDGTDTIPTIGEIITESELQELLGIDPETGLIATIKCARDSAPTISGHHCGFKILGETTIDSDLYVRGNVQWNGIASGNGTNITNIQFALQSGYATNAGYATFADSATIAARADSADHSRFSLLSDVSKQQEVSTAQTDAPHYLLLAQTIDGVDSVEGDGQLFYNPTTDILDAGAFRGNGSLLTNITVSDVEATVISAGTTASTDNHYVMFREQLTGIDSVNTDNSLQYNPDGNYITGGVTFDGEARYALNTQASNATGTSNFITMRATSTGEDSVNTHAGVTYNATNETLFATNLSGNGSNVTNVDAVTATTATNIDITAVADNSIYYPVYTPSASGGNTPVTNTSIRFQPGEEKLSIATDTAKLTLGTDSDSKIYHDGSNTYIDTITGGLNITNSTGTNVVLLTGLPTVDTGLASGQIWNDGGTLKISAGS